LEVKRIDSGEVVVYKWVDKLGEKDIENDYYWYLDGNEFCGNEKNGEIIYTRR